MRSKDQILLESLYSKILKEDMEYRGEHTAPSSENAPAYDLTMNEVYPKDVYDMPSWYEQGESLLELRKILSLKDKPDYPVWIYRAIPKTVYENLMKKAKSENSSLLKMVFKDGEWVTTNKKYAIDHGTGTLNNEYKVVALRTKAKNIFTNGDSIMEWGYYN